MRLGSLLSGGGWLIEAVIRYSYVRKKQAGETANFVLSQLLEAIIL